MSKFQRIDHILFNLCAEGMMDASERHWASVRCSTSAANLALAIVDHREKRRKAF